MSLNNDDDYDTPPNLKKDSLSFSPRRRTPMKDIEQGPFMKSLTWPGPNASSKVKSKCQTIIPFQGLNSDVENAASSSLILKAQQLVLKNNEEKKHTIEITSKKKLNLYPDIVCKKKPSSHTSLFNLHHSRSGISTSRRSALHSISTTYI